MKITVTLEFSDANEAATALGRLATPTIAHMDRPDVGAPPPTSDAAAATGLRQIFGQSPLASSIFGQTPAPAPAPIIPPPAAVTTATPTPAPSTAVAEVPPTAPVAPTSTAVAAPPVPALPPVPGVTAHTQGPSGAVTFNPVDIDKDGLPWDARIHAKSADGSHPKNADGTWRSKRNVDQSVKIAVEAELRAALAANSTVAAGSAFANPSAVPTAGATPLPPLPPTAVPPVPAAFPASSSASTGAIPLPPMPPTPGGTAAPVAAWTYSRLMERASELMLAGKMPFDALQTAMTKHGLTNPTQLIIAPDVVQAIGTELFGAP